MKAILAGSWAVFAKDFHIEWRQRYAVNALLMFAASALFVVLFATASEVLSTQIQAALLWIVILFSAAVGLGRAFVSEVEQQTFLLLQLHARPSVVYIGKLCYSFLLVLVLSILAAAAFLVMAGAPSGNVLQLGLILLLGAIGLSGATTLIGAIIARTANQGPLFAVLSFPVLIPLLITVVNGTRKAMLGAGWADISEQILALTGYAGVVITASILLFDYVWNE